MNTFSNTDYGTLREVDERDCDLLYQWTNDMEVRRNSFSTSRIKYEDHVRWFRSKLNDKACCMFILTIDNHDVGLIRIDIVNGNGIISYSICSNFRERGYGFKIIKLLEHKIEKQHMKLKQLHAEVKHNNIASQKIFKKLGYEEKVIRDKLFYKKTL
ncbi:GNAT family N-acetyltransferase [Clostridium sp. UBA4548]|uniref:GNAT family N-acetyltransferase n=1 Tax=Clostridium sp. UBA4548 TaxID=1946361 RepID=UPI0025C11E0F|nr:GNAT family N-acetyltransferase [Clostridium sp. UBA4548]